MTGDGVAGTMGGGHRAGSEETLRDGRVVTCRPLSARDADAIESLWRRLDAAERHRFVDLAHLPLDDPGALAAERPGHVGGVVAVAARGSSLSVVGVARFERTAVDAAEFLVFVDASYRRCGLGITLLRHLAELARRAGLRRLVSDVPKDDVPVLGLLADLGLGYEERARGGRVQASFAVQETNAYLDAVLADQRVAAGVALKPFLRPRSIAVVGASDAPASIGGLLLANLRHSGFEGPLYPVNPHHRVVQGLPCHPRLASCPGVPDLVVIAVPAQLVAGVVEEAGAVGNRAACVISAGFAEAGAGGRALQDDLLSRARAVGVRLVGPNCMGLANGGPEPRFNATFSPVFPPAGAMGFVSQSGALGLAALALLEGPSLGMSGIVSLGNSADLGPNDLLLYFDQDPGTDLVLAYLESVPDPRRFARIARRVSRHKPVVVMKSGRSGAGRRAASSHTAAIAAGDVAVEALFHQAGVIRVDALEEMFDLAALASLRRAPRGRRVAVLTNGGGPGILVADACEAAGLLVPVLSEGVQASLRVGLPAEAAVANPVDMVASASAEDYGRCARLLGGAEEVDAIIVVFVPPFLTRAEDVAAELAAAAGDLPADKPVVAVFMTSGASPGSLAQAGVPSFVYPERAAAALGRMARWAEWRARPAGRVVTPQGIDSVRGRAIVAEALDSGPKDGWVGSRAVEDLLAAYGVPLARALRVCTGEEAAAAQAELGTRTVVKVAAPIHKSDVGAVAVDIDSPEGAAEALERIRAALRTSGLGEAAAEFLVQEQVHDGVEMIVGVFHDPAFGPLVMAGLGGTTVELLGDVALRLTPLSDTDVDEMLRSLRSYRLLTGYRQAPPLDVAAFEGLLHRVSAMVEDLPEIAELDLNPVFVLRQGVVAVDARVRLAA